MATIIERETAAASRQRMITRKGTALWHTAYIGPNFTSPDRASPAGSIEPVAYLVEQEPASVVPAHFHGVDQFQVVVSGAGRLNERPVAPICVHYTNGYTAYGPIVAGADGVAYMTFRNRSDGPAWFLPEARDILRGKRREGREVVGHGALADAYGAETILIAPSADGLMASLHVLRADESLQGPDPARGAGQYWLIVAGTLRREGATSLSRMSCVFVGADDPVFRCAAGAQGATVVAMQFPRR